MNKKGQVIYLIGIMLGAVLIVTIFWCAGAYIDLRIVIHECNKNLGKGNWTFTEEHNFVLDTFSCKAYNQQSYISSNVVTISSKTCYENGKEVNCQ